MRSPNHTRWFQSGQCVPRQRHSFNAVTALALVLVVAVACVALSAQPASAAVSFSNVADTTTTAPGHGAFTSFGVFPSVSASNVAFQGFYSGGRGIYSGSVGATGAAKVVDTGDTAPGHGAFAGFFNPSLSGSNLAFLGFYSGGEGIYSGSVGVTGAAKVVDTSDTAPGHGAFTGFGIAPSVSGSNLAFHGRYNDGHGIYTGSVGAMGAAKVVDFTDTAPGQGAFNGLGPPSVSGSNVAFRGEYIGGSGIYLASGGAGGSLSAVLNTGDPLFGSTVTGLNMGGFAYDNDAIAFQYTLANGRSGIGVATIPEPASLALLLLAAVGVSLHRNQTLRSRYTNAVTALALLLAMAVVPMARGQASFQGLGNLGKGTPFAWTSAAYGLSGDGSTAVGNSGSYYPPPAYWGDEAFRWTAATGMQGLGDLPGGSTSIYSVAHGASHDGSAIVGKGSSEQYPSEAFRWTSADGMQGLGTLSAGFASSAQAISGDGSTIVGWSRGPASDFEAFRWTSSDGMQGLGDLPGGEFWSIAHGVSADGTVIVGTGSSELGGEAFRWTSADGMQGLGYPLGYEYGSDASAISADGSTIVGNATYFDGFYSSTQAFRWTDSGGMQVLGLLPGADTFGQTSLAAAVSGDGSIIVGSSYAYFFDTMQFETRAFIWDAVHGMRSLRDVLINDYGLDLTGWRFNGATGISVDGQTIVGTGANPSGFAEGWIAVLPEPVTPLPGDFNGDGSVDGADLTNWMAGIGTTGAATHMQGDADGDSDVDGGDFLVWQRQIGSGPPLTPFGAAVPEPASVVLFGVGLCSLVIASRHCAIQVLPVF